MMTNCELMNVESKGCAFTWANNREGEELIKKRLDRVICSMEWRVVFAEAEATPLPVIGLDHSPFLLEMYPRRQKSKKLIRIEAYWLEDPECEDLVKEAWSGQSLGMRRKSHAEKL